MPQVYNRTRTFTVQPADRTANETIILMAVKKGFRILAVAMERKVLGSTANTISLRASTAAGGASAGLQGALDTSTSTAGSIVGGAGADLATSGGFLCTADGTLDAVYTAVGGGGSTVPVVRVSVTWTIDPVVAGQALG